MKIYNQDKMQELTEKDIDFEKGYLKKDTLEVIIPAIEGVEEIGHYETLKVYPNGGKDVKWIVDVPGVEKQEEQHIKEDIQVYILFSEAELEEIENNKKVQEARQYLNDTDYIANKIIEYQFLGKELDNDYSETLQKREEAREVIRQFEKGSDR